MGTCPSKPGTIVSANQGVNAKKNNSASKGISGPVIPVNKGINSKKNPSNNKPKVLSEREQIQKRINEIEDFMSGTGQDAQYSLDLQGEHATLESEKKKLEQRLKDLTTGIPVPIGPEENEKPEPSAPAVPIRLEPSAPELPNASVNQKTNNNPTNPPTQTGGKKTRKTKRKQKHPKKQKKHPKK